MEFLIDPNVAYVLLIIGVLLSLLALVSPGTGMLELGAVFTLVLVGYAAYKLGINSWAIVPLALAIAPFLLALRYKKWQALLLAVSIVLASVGAAFLFPGEDGSLIGVNPLLVLSASVLYGGILWIVVDRTLAVMGKPVIHNQQALIGQLGEARTEIKDDGSVQAGGELWSARSENPIPAGSAVRIVSMEGFVLIVEKAS